MGEWMADGRVILHVLLSRIWGSHIAAFSQLLLEASRRSLAAYHHDRTKGYLGSEPAGYSVP
jgi:hypothetical protein